jgi:internalin A
LPELECSENQISNLEPLRALTNLQTLGCDGSHWDKKGKIASLETLRALTNLQTLGCYGNKINDLEPLCILTNLQFLWCCWNNPISDLELDKFKKAVPHCRVD